MLKIKHKEPIFALIMTGIQSFITIFLTEVLYRGGFSPALEWTKDYTRPFTYNFLLLFLLLASLHMFKRKLYIILSYLITIPLLFLGLASNVKQGIRGVPVLPTDLSLAAEARSMAEFFSGTLHFWTIVFLVVLSLLGIFLVYKIPNQQGSNLIRFLTSVVLLTAFIVIFRIESSNDSTFLKRKLMIIYQMTDQRTTYEIDGLMAGFIQNLKWLKQEIPIGYSQSAINTIISKSDVPEYPNDNDKPNIIMIMNEAFWDPTKMESVVFNQDPLPYFHQLQQEASSGSLNVTVFGGSTVNTEFEALTGLSTHFLPSGSIAYLNYVKKPLPSLPTILRKQGYDTTAIHSWHHWFYDRSGVYRDLGFNRFISMEFMGNPIAHGPFFRDKSVTDEILKKLKQENSGKPNFIFAVTTQNHGPYSTDKKEAFSTIETHLKGDASFSDEAESMLEVYSDNLLDIDQDLERLINELNTMDKKTILIFFGDHLPLLGNEYMVYEEANFYQGTDSYEEYLNMYSTPLLIWDNYSNKKESINIGSSMLTPIILNRAGLTGNPFTNYLLSKYLNDGLSKIPREDFYAVEQMDNETLTELKMLQYDILFGKMYFNDNKKIEVSKNYRLGYKDPKITSISIRKGKDKIVVKGQNFTHNSYVFIDGTAADKISGNTTNITIPFTELKKGTEIMVKVIDQNEKILSSSNKYIYE
ncbi:LTA synthase family protein [Neobacillus niacini]|uniref:LTA synthase family protein n=1 Tax=Neobacillus niacini TaxID=86668 RepID=UPI0007ABEAB7|nr:LTA synthase family protein [Neobacillus niacini]MEC1525872.1 LTA synthase family protein [Neobacillus niacini]